jgi:class 3 adenylate cyclase/predicted ATPase
VDELEKWLTPLGLAPLAPALRANDIDLDILPALTEQDLEKLGLSLGNRRKLLRAAANLPRSSSSSLSATPNPNAAAERRQLTVMFCDLVGSTALSARLDPEDMREIIGAYHGCCAEYITKAGGFVAKYMGDGVLAYFGYPQAHEDDAERAVRSALSLIEVVPLLRTGHQAALQVRVGIATGVVVVGDLIGEGAAQEQGVVGDTPNFAARLQSLAEPGQVAISHGTRRLTGGLFDYRDLGHVTLKGLANPVQAWQVTGATAVQSRFEAQHETTLTPLVGRGEELELLLRRWREAASGEGRVVLLSGEPGIGKSRLTVALEERLQSEPYARLRNFCSPHHSDSALYPTIVQLEALAEFERTDLPQAKFEKLASLLGALPGHESNVQLLAELLSISTVDRYAPLSWSPQRKKEKTFEALLGLLEMLSRRRPVLAVYEDVHWIDPSSRELLDMTVERVARLPVLLVITFRPEFQPPWPGPAHVSTLNLNRLGRREGAALAALVASDNTLTRDMTAEIVERTDGIPLFVEELTKAVLEAGALGEGGRKIITTIPPSALAIPATLHASLIARLDRLGPLAKEVAQVGAVIGREFPYELLASVAQRSEHDLQAALGRLTDAGLVFCRGTPPQATLLFKHALVRDAAYGTLLRSQRQALHGRIAAMLEERFPDIVDQQPEQLAQHWTEAGSTKEAIAYWTKAARQSLIRYALVEAMAQLGKGLALLPNLVESPERWRHELELQTVLGWTHFHAKGEGVPAAGDALLRARTLSERLGDRSTLSPVLYMQGSHYVARAEYSRARHVTEELLHVAREHGDAALEMHAHQILGRILHWLGAFASAVEHLEDALRVRVTDEHDEHSWYILVDASRTVALTYLATDLMILGHLDQAVARSEEALALGKKARRPYALAIALGFAALVNRLRGANEAALDYLAESAAIGSEQGFPLFVTLADLQRASILSARGETGEGLARARQACADLAAAGHHSGKTRSLAWLADCCERAGEIDEALELLTAALATVSASEERYFEAELHRLRGDWFVTHRRASEVEAEACFERALAVAREQEAKLWELRAANSLARLWRDQGKRATARDLLAPIYGWFTEGFDTLDLKEAKALLEELA